MWRWFQMLFFIKPNHVNLMCTNADLVFQKQKNCKRRKYVFSDFCYSQKWSLPLLALSFLCTCAKKQCSKEKEHISANYLKIFLNDHAIILCWFQNSKSKTRRSWNIHFIDLNLVRHERGRQSHQGGSLLAPF